MAEEAEMKETFEYLQAIRHKQILDLVDLFMQKQEEPAENQAKEAAADLAEESTALGLSPN